MRNLGKASWRMLEEAGIANVDCLREVGAIRSYLRVKDSGCEPSLNLLYALEGGLAQLGGFGTL